MTGLKELLLSEKNRLEEIIQKVTGRLQDAPEGSLRVSRSHNISQY